MSHIWRAPLAIATLAFALAGCGGSSDESTDGGASNDAPAAETQPLTKAELITKGDAICTEMKNAVEAIDGSTETPETIADGVEKTVGAYETMIADLRKLTPPTELAGDYQAWLAGNDEYKAMLTQFADVARKNDEAAAQQLQPKMEAKTEELTSMSKGIGFKVCTQYARPVAARADSRELSRA